MYHFKENRDRRGHFWFDRKLIENKNWSLLSNAGKAVYPVIAAHRNAETGEAFPCERTIAIQSGKSDKVVRNGIRELLHFPGVETTQYITSRGRRSKKFKIEKPPRDKGRAFPFYKDVIEAGLWSQMKPTAHALYPVMRHYGFFDYDLYTVTEEIDDMEEGSDLIFSEREWDACEAEYDVMATYAGITRRSILTALQSLEEVGLIERHDMDNCWKVYIRPMVYYKRDFLNEQTVKRYRHLIEG